MKKICCLGLALLMALTGFAQNEGNIWMFGGCNSITFTNGTPVYGGVPGTGNTSMTTGFYRSNAIADASGNLLFYVKISNADAAHASTRSNIFDRNGNAMANSVLVTASPVAGPIQIIKKPGNNRLYYVIYALNGALLSTTVDMGLNVGLGGVVASEKGVILSGWQTIVGEKTAVVQGCDCIWLVVRSRTANQYKSYRITDAGIDHNPVLSDCGLLPLSNYFDVYIGPQGGATANILGQPIGKAGLLKVSPDGKKMVACCGQGLELYDFSKCSGKVSNARLLDTTITFKICYYGAVTGYTCFDSLPVSYYSAAFSPDNSKLYATYFYGRKVYQFNLSLTNTAAIMNSKIAVLANRPVIEADLINGCTIIDTTAMGDLKRGADGKIYIGNNTLMSCDVTPQSSHNMALHAINKPNLPGLACDPEQEAFILGPLTDGKFQTSVNFNPQIVMPPSVRDSLTSTNNIVLCKGNILQADTPGDCYQWNTGAQTPAITVDSSGIYTVRWSGEDCTYHEDTFIVSVAPFPEVPLLQYGCPDAIRLTIRNKPDDTSTYAYELNNENSSVSLHYVSAAGWSLNDLPAGSYTLYIASAGGCDTTLTLQLDAYPKPVLSLRPEDTTISYGEPIRLHASGAYWYIWSPSGSLDTATIASPLARPAQPTEYLVVGVNEYGCRDTGHVRVNIDYRMLELIPNAFSPNGDGLNDVFRIEGMTYQKVLTFNIYSRYGQRIFSTVDGHKGWDGRQNGQPCDAGTYYYFIKLAYPDGRIGAFRGDVTLIR